MSILQIALALIVLPGMFRVFKAISGFFENHPKLHLQRNAKKIAFVFVVVTAALFATPLLTLGLPAAFRLVAWGIYLAYVVTGALYVWDFISGFGNRGTKGTK